MFLAFARKAAEPWENLKGAQEAYSARADGALYWFALMEHGEPPQMGLPGGL